MRKEFKTTGVNGTFTGSIEIDLSYVKDVLLSVSLPMGGISYLTGQEYKVKGVVCGEVMIDESIESRNLENRLISIESYIVEEINKRASKEEDNSLLEHLLERGYKRQ